MTSKNLFSLLILLLLVQAGWTQAPQNDRYILAPSGLNMRASSDPASSKITRIGYGEKVELLAAPSQSAMLIDNIPGGMAQVKYNGKTGYAFDGYLSRFPAPAKNAENDEYIADYAEEVRAAGYNVLYEKINRDYGGYYQFEEALVINGKDLMDGYLIARELWGLPKNLHLPQPGGKPESTVENPDKNPNAWSDDLTVKCNAAGNIEEIWYGYRAEATGKSVIIKADPEQEDHIRIAVIFIAD